MYFRRWLMKEMGHIEVQGTVRGKGIDSIDPMFENYPPEMREEWHSGMFDFYGEIPNTGKFLVNKADSERGATAFISNSEPVGSHRLPDEWWDYAKVFYDDGTVKMPDKPATPTGVESTSAWTR